MVALAIAVMNVRCLVARRVHQLYAGLAPGLTREEEAVGFNN